MERKNIKYRTRNIRSMYIPTFLIRSLKDFNLLIESALKLSIITAYG